MVNNTYKVKWLRIILLLGVILLSIISPYAVQAVDPIVSMSVSAFTGGITGFTITYVSDTNLKFDWGFSGDAVKIMIRGKYGEYPADIPNQNTTPSDGYLVYYGDLTTCNDTSLNFDENAGPIYYKAWAQRADLTWHMDFDTGWEESAALLLIALIVLSVGFTIASFIFKKGMLAFAGAGAWMITGIYCYTKAIAMWDVYYSMFWLFMGLTIACAFSPLQYRETTPATEEAEEPEDREMREEIEAIHRQNARYVYLNSRRKPKKGMSKFARTGED